MKLKEYREQFFTYYEDAEKIFEECQTFGRSFEVLQENFIKLGYEAGQCYSNNNNFGTKDYEERVKIFLDFDNHLKHLKRQFAQKNNNSAFFGHGILEKEEHRFRPNQNSGFSI